MARAKLKLQHLFFERCLPSLMAREVVPARSGPYDLVDGITYRPGAQYSVGSCLPDSNVYKLRCSFEGGFIM